MENNAQVALALQRGDSGIINAKKDYLSVLKKEFFGNAEALYASDNIVLRKLGSLAGAGYSQPLERSTRLESNAASRITANMYVETLRLDMSTPYSEWRKTIANSPKLKELILDFSNIKIAESLIEKCSYAQDRHVSVNKEEVECFIKSVFESQDQVLIDRLFEHIFNVSARQAGNVLWGLHTKKLMTGEQMVRFIVLRSEEFLNAITSFIAMMKIPNRQAIIDRLRSRVLLGETLENALRDVQFACNVPVEIIQDIKGIIAKNPYNAAILEVGPMLLLEHEKVSRYDDKVGLSKQVSRTIWETYSAVRKQVVRKKPTASSQGMLTLPNKVSAQPMQEHHVSTELDEEFDTEIAEISSIAPDTPVPVPEVSIVGKAPETKVSFDIQAILGPTGYAIAPNRSEGDLAPYFNGLPALSQYSMSKYYFALQKAKQAGVVIRK